MRNKQSQRIKVGLFKSIQKIDVKSGRLSFGQRIELGKIISSDKDDITTLIEVINCLHDFRPTKRQIIIMSKYIDDILHGLKYWNDAENTLLKYDPTPEEKMAGIQSLSKKIGSMGTVDALAEKYGVDPDIIINWEYAKVFGILFADLEKAKYQRSYQKVIEKKK